MVQHLAHDAAAAPHLLNLSRRFADNRHDSCSNSSLVAGRHPALALDHFENLLGDLVDRQVAIHRNQPPFARVVFGYGLGLQFVGRQSFPDDFFTVIFAGHQRRTINIASISDTGWLGVDVVDPSTDGTRTASSNPT